MSGTGRTNSAVRTDSAVPTHTAHLAPFWLLDICCRTAHGTVLFDVHMFRKPGLLFTCLLGRLLSSGAMAAPFPDFALPGPCATSKLAATINPSPQVVSGGIPATLPVTLTLPSCSGPDTAATLPFGPAPFPVLIFFSGFMVSDTGLVLRIFGHIFVRC